MQTPPIEWLKQAADGKMDVTGVNVWKALRYRAFIQVLDRDLNVLSDIPRLDKDDSSKDKKDSRPGSKVPRLDRVFGFRVTQRGYDLLEGPAKATLPFSIADPPNNIKWWVSSFKRWARQCPEGFVIAQSGGKLHILVKDKDGKVKDNPAHRLASVDVPWHGS